MGQENVSSVGNSRLLGPQTVARTVGFLDRLLSPKLLSSGPGTERQRGRVMAGVCLIGMGLSVFLASALQDEQTAVATTGVFALGVGSLAALASLRIGLRISLVSNFLVGVVYCVLMGLTLPSGGAAIMAMMALAIVPMIAMLLSGFRAGLVWTAAVVSGIGLTALSVPPGDIPMSDFLNQSWIGTRFWVAGLACVGLTGVGFVYATLNAFARSEVTASIEELAAGEARYRSLAENAGDCVSDFDERGRCTYMSPNSHQTIGYEPDQVLGLGLSRGMAPAELELFIEALRKSQRDLESFQLSIQYEHAEGHTVPLELSVNSYVDPAGQTRSVCVARDVSELRRAEAAVRHSECLASTGTLAAGVAHQVNNPVGAILTGSEFALLELDDGNLESVRDVLQTNVEQARRCGSIVHSLLQFARTQPVSKEPLELFELISETIALTTSYAQTGGVKVELISLDRGHKANVNAIEIEQVVVNLIRNAVEASSSGDRVEVRLLGGGDHVLVQVEDQGRGVSDAALPRVFDPFYTTRIQEGGSGLGLSVAHGIVTDHGGSMVFESELGHGTTVSFRLPIAD